MGWSYTSGSGEDLDRVRLLCTDIDEENTLFEDEEIVEFLELEGGSVKRAAALALETVASQEALLLKVLQISSLHTDGAKLMDALLKRAGLLRAQASHEAASTRTSAGRTVTGEVIPRW